VVRVHRGPPRFSSLVRPHNAPRPRRLSPVPCLPGARGYPVDPAAIQRQHVEEFLIQLQTEPLARTGKPASPATVRNRFSALRRLFNWLEEEEEIDRSPMARMKCIQVEEPTPEVLNEAELRRLLKACEGKEFEDRRDMAVLRLMIDTGLRRTSGSGQSRRSREMRLSELKTTNQVHERNLQDPEYRALWERTAMARGTCGG
jgi:integrase